MNKFLKGAIACAAVVPLATGLIGCTDKEKEYTGEDAFNAVFAQVDSMVDTMSGITNPGSEFQLNINLNLDVKTLVEGVPLQDEAIVAKLRAVIGGRHQSNKELFGNIGFVDEQDTFTSLLSAYAIDDIDTNIEIDEDEEYTAIPEGVINDSNWATYKGIVYVDNEGSYVLAENAFDENTTYYMLTEDLMHIYLASNPLALATFTLTTEQPVDWTGEYTSYYTKQGDNYYKVEDAAAPKWQAETYYQKSGVDINDYLGMITGGEIQLPQGKIYSVLNIGDELPSQEPGTGSEPEDDGMDLTAMLSSITNMDYDTFVESMSDGTNVTVTGEKLSNGDQTMKMVANGSEIKFTAKASGGINVSMQMLMPGEDEGIIYSISVIIDINLEDEVEDEYIPINLSDYGASQGNFEDVIMGLLGMPEDPAE